ncbi:MAG: response regulator transcription factor [Geodermatophilaceae bacterium]
MRALVVEDEKRLAAGLRSGLEAEGFAVDVALDGTDGLWMARERPHDIIVLDIMLPGVNGFTICRTLRQEKIWTPILMLTAKDGESDEVEALDAGADDYLTKPFSYAVLLARMRALLRRGVRRRPAVLEAGDLRLDPATKRVTRAGIEVAMTARELSVLEFLLRRSGQVVSKREILDHVWDYDFEGDPNIVEVYVGHLRNKLDRPSGGGPSRPSAGRATDWPRMSDDRGSRPQGGATAYPVPAEVPRRRSTSVRVRTTVGAVLVVGLALLIGSLGLVALLDRTLTGDVRTTAIARAEEVAAALANTGDPGPLSVADDEEQLIQVLDGRGDVVASSSNVAGRDAVSSLRPGQSVELDNLLETAPFLVVATAAQTADGDVTVVVARSLSDASEAVLAVRRLLAVGVPVLLLVVGATTWKVVGRALRPVAAIRERSSRSPTPSCTAACRSRPAGTRSPIWRRR